MLPPEYQKRSFLRFDVPIDLAAIVKEYYSIPDSAWATSYWGDVHCSVGMLLLRGGSSGTERDFYSDSVADSPLLSQLPVISALLDEDGPFGSAQYAFLFRTQPRGVTLVHQDLIDKWQDMFRIHVPIITNPGAHLIADGLSMHFAAGSAWSFDNHSRHGVVNGDVERIHLIFDVPLNPRLAACIDRAEFLPGHPKPAHVRKIESTKKVTRSYPGDEEMMKAVVHLSSQGLDNRKIADMFNAKEIPTKQYHIKNRRHQTKKWNARMVTELRAEMANRPTKRENQPTRPGY